MTIDEVIEPLRAASAGLETGESSVSDQLALMAEAGVMRWGIPPDRGGIDLSPADQAAGHQRLASACLVSTFVLSQRDSAVSRIVACENDSLRNELLPHFAAHELMATVGISHLTTSRQHLAKPSVAARADGDSFVLEGFVPWVTGASLSDFVLTGGTVEDGRQILALVETADPGVTIAPPPELLAMGPSATSSLTLEAVRISSDRVVAGPVEGVVKSLSGGTGGITTSALAVGAAAGVLEHFATEAEKRPELGEFLEPLANERAAVSAGIRRLLESPEEAASDGLTAESIRRRANSLALRSSQAYLAASKGAGFVKGHPAERAVREAIFFLVWSCPRPVVESALREFACLGE